MSLVAWFPLNNNLKNQGTCGTDLVNTGAEFSDTGKITKYCNKLNSTKSGEITIKPLIGKKVFTISFWYKGDSTETATLYSDLLSIETVKTDATESVPLRVEIIDNNQLCVFNNGHWSTLDGLGRLDFDDTWHLYTFVFTAKNCISYLDGIANETIVEKENIDKVSLNGIFRLGDTEKSTGYINDLRIYDTALSKKEIQELSKGLCLHYAFNIEDLYIPVDYIESTGTQYIDTGISPNEENITWELDGIFKYQYGVASQMGAMNNGVRFHIGAYAYTEGTFHPGLGDGYNSSASGILPWDSNRHKFILNSIDKTFSVDDISYPAAEWDNPPTSYDLPTNSLYLFAGNWNTTGAEQYSNFKLYKSRIIIDNNLVRDFIPVIRKSDGKPGLLDLVENKFYINQGTGEFLSNTNIFRSSYLDSDYFIYHKAKHYYTNPEKTDTRTPFQFSTQLCDSGKNYIKDIGTNINLAANTIYNFAFNHNEFTTDTAYILVKHNGSTTDLKFAYLPVELDKNYTVSIEASSVDPTTTNGINITKFIFSTCDQNIGTIRDASGYGNTGKINSNITTLDSDLVLGNNSIKCNKSAVYTSMPITFDNYSIACWFRLGAEDTMLFGSNESDSSRNHKFYCYGDRSWKYTTSATTESEEMYYTELGGTRSTDNWVFWVATYDGEYTRIYRNGIQEKWTDSTELPGRLTTGTITFANLSIGDGYERNNDTEHFHSDNQRIADFKLYATALSQEDILDLYKCKAEVIRNGKLYCDEYTEITNKNIELPTRTGLIRCDNLTENTTLNQAMEIVNDRYTLLEYIESTDDGNQYIDTGINLTYDESLPSVKDILNVSLDIEFNKNKNNDKRFISVETLEPQAGTNFDIYFENELRYRAGYPLEYIIKKEITEDVIRATIAHTLNSGIRNIPAHIAYLDGEKIEQQSLGGFKSNPNTLYLFARHGDSGPSNYGVFRLYSCTIKKYISEEQEYITYNFKPAIKHLANKDIIGLARVDNDDNIINFLENLGTSAFIAGPIRNKSSKLKILEIEEK